jgi:hypothetical protein
MKSARRWRKQSKKKNEIGEMHRQSASESYENVTSVAAE